MKSKSLLHLLFCLCLATQAVQAKPVTYLWDYEELKALKAQPQSSEYRNIIASANRVLKTVPVAVTQKTKCISGDPHNYESLATYCWPDPKNPKGPYIILDGKQNPEIENYDFARLLSLNTYFTIVSKAFFLTGDNRYYDSLCRQIDIWFINDSTRMNPHLDYSQFIPGWNDNLGNAGGVLDAYRFVDVLEGISLVNSVKTIGNKRLKILKRWFNDLARWIEDSPNGKKALLFKNNHAIANQGTLIRFYLFTGKRRLVQTHFKVFSRLVEDQVDERGTMPEELKRNNAFTYSIFNLNHILDIVTMAKTGGLDMPPEMLSRIGKGCRYLESFIGAQERFPFKEMGNWNSCEANLKRELKRARQLLLI